MPIAPIPPIAPLDQIVQNQALTAGMLQATGQAQVTGAAGSSSASPLASFQNFFANAINDAGSLQARSASLEKGMLVGGAGTDNFHDGFIAMEKADLAFQLTMAVRDKVISAYQTVMQMSV
ncbi:MAG: flagellar hook-basal body complex protein FliE [bacterium]